jgi:hypothetical protein
MESNAFNEDNDDTAYEIEIGLYPGILFGIRTYVEKDYKTHVVYLPFIDLAITVYK